MNVCKYCDAGSWPTFITNQRAKEEGLTLTRWVHDLNTHVIDLGRGRYRVESFGEPLYVQCEKGEEHDAVMMNAIEHPMIRLGGSNG